MMKKYLVLDAGGTFTKYALLDENAVILEKDKVLTPGYEDHTKEEFYQVLDSIVEKYADRIEGIAISMPGMMDSRRGYCMTAGYLAYLSESPVADELEARYGFPVSIENDGKCAALAESWKGSLEGIENGAVVVLGTGVAGGLIIGGELYRGNCFTAGEYSYVVSDIHEKRKQKGYWGMSGGVGGLAECVASVTGESADALDGMTIFERVNDGDSETLQGLKKYTDNLAVQIYNLNAILDLDVIAVGGGISQQPLLLEYIKKSLDELLGDNPLRKISPYIPRPKIVNCTFYNDANLIGALYHYKKQKENQTTQRREKYGISR